MVILEWNLKNGISVIAGVLFFVLGISSTALGERKVWIKGTLEKSGIIHRNGNRFTGQGGPQTHKFGNGMNFLVDPQFAFNNLGMRPGEERRPFHVDVHTPEAQAALSLMAGQPVEFLAVYDPHRPGHLGSISSIENVRPIRRPGHQTGSYSTLENLKRTNGVASLEIPQPSREQLKGTVMEVTRDPNPANNGTYILLSGSNGEAPTIARFDLERKIFQPNKFEGEQRHPIDFWPKVKTTLLGKSIELYADGLTFKTGRDGMKRLIGMQSHAPFAMFYPQISPTCRALARVGEDYPYRTQRDR
jgi:hypothetical protein